ncbi:hypothetical protein [Croceicoccus naphthovorans]|uniref:hypothetical protein n=1 Tax=Croceicoccus naphthovorans TaxID=1348774 RepID=UPI000A80B5A0|nr:hypothetical protein [Croceicoccus naphthovorans]MBB3990256.1 type II secretory pathway pseudopilin PulG [Croceicoccus naphthovorans]
MPIWIELLVAMLIVYGAVLVLALAFFSRRVRLARLTKMRAARMVYRGTAIEEDT